MDATCLQGHLCPDRITDSAAIAASVEQLDFSPSCEGRPHKTDPPPADFLVDLHGCAQKFGCAACVQLDRDIFARLREVGVKCEGCGMYFYEFERAITKVVPL